MNTQTEHPEQRDTLECDNCGKPTDHLDCETGEQVCHKCGIVYGDIEQRDTAQHSPDEIQIGAITIPADVYLIIKRQRDADEAKLKAHAERLAEAVKRLAIAVEALEGQEIEYRLAMELSNAAGNGRRELAAWEGAKP